METAVMGREWMVVEHENGRVEDLGLVDVRVLGGGPGSQRFQWHSRDVPRQGAARLNPGDFDGVGLRRPLEVKMREGGRQYWYVGAHAQARMAAFRFNKRVHAPRSTSDC